MLHFGIEPMYILHASSPYWYWLMYEIWTISTHSIFTYPTNITFKKNIGIYTQIWNRAKLYFTCITNTWYLITVLKYEYNQLIPLWDITTTAQNAWKGGHNYPKWLHSQMLFYKHEQHTAPDNCSNYGQNQM